MRNLVLPLLLLVTSSLFAQKKVLSKVNDLITSSEIEAHLTFLAADEMRGRNTGSPEIDIAANYLAAQLKIMGVKPVTGTKTYFQEVKLEKITAPSQAEFTVGEDVFRLKDDILYISGGSTSQEKDVIFIGYGTQEDFEKNDVKDKIVVTYAGTPATKSAVRAVSTDSPVKNKLAVSHGAAALVEIMALPGVPWQVLVNYLSSPRMITQKEQRNTFPHVLMKNTDVPGIKSLLETKQSKGKLVVSATEPSVVNAKNVAGIIEGTDATLKNEWIAITAHYDHVGVKKNNSPDSIYNGARDNAIGTVALLEAAKFLGMNPPKRSILLMAFTGEEAGLLGSQWYSNHPLIPLNKTVFNFNCDGGGYNDKTMATVIDLNRTTADGLMIKGCQAYGLALKGDPAPEQNLYERSDNFNFAVKGVPSVNISPGVKAFDQEVLKYYHQPTDEVSTLDMEYLEKFYRSYVYCAYLITNATERPVWKQGDKFEETGKNLYSK